MEDLRDIKEIVEVHDSSLLLLMATIIITLLLITLFIYLLRKKRRRRRLKPSARVLAKAPLQGIDYDDAKEAAYVFSEHAHLFITEDNMPIYEKIDKELETYKYKKEVPALDAKTAEAMRTFIKGILWSR